MMCTVMKDQQGAVKAHYSAVTECVVVLHFHNPVHLILPL